MSSPDWATQLQKAIELIETEETRRECTNWISSGFYGINSATISFDDINKVVAMYLKHLKIIKDTDFVTKGDILLNIMDAITLMHQKDFPSFLEVDEGSNEKINSILNNLKKLTNDNSDISEDLKDEVLEFCESSPGMPSVENIYSKFHCLKGSTWTDGWHKD